MYYFIYKQIGSNRKSRQDCDNRWLIECASYSKSKPLVATK